MKTDVNLMGQTIEEFHVIELLAKNEMTHVYKCQHNDNFFVMKVLFDDNLKRSIYERFKREIDILTKLHHPNIVRAYHCNKSSDGSFWYYVMEFVDGVTLAEILGSCPLEEIDVVKITQSLLQALYSLREKNIVHRDIKPENIMLTKNLKIKLLDLGLAKEFGDTNRVTLHGLPAMGIGSPYFQAPEIGIKQPPTFLTDIYSLGATIYCLFSGIPPYSDLVRNSQLSYFEVIKKSFPTYLKKLAPHISDEFAKLTHAMLDKEPQARPNLEQVESYLEKIYQAVAHHPYPSQSLISSLRKLFKGSETPFLQENRHRSEKKHSLLGKLFYAQKFTVCLLERLRFFSLKSEEQQFLLSWYRAAPLTSQQQILNTSRLLGKLFLKTEQLNELHLEARRVTKGDMDSFALQFLEIYQILTGKHFQQERSARSQIEELLATQQLEESLVAEVLFFFIRREMSEKER